MWRGLVGLTLLLAGAAHAAVIDGRATTRGALATNQAADGVSANQVNFGEAYKGRWLYVESINTGTTGAGVALEVNCAPVNATDFALRWVVVPGGGVTSLQPNVTQAVQVNQPACMYRAAVSACTGCSVTVRFLAGPEIQ